MEKLLDTQTEVEQDRRSAQEKHLTNDRIRAEKKLEISLNSEQAEEAVPHRDSRKLWEYFLSSKGIRYSQRKT